MCAPFGSAESAGDVVLGPWALRGGEDLLGVARLDAGAASLARGREALSRLLESGFTGGAIFCSSDLLAHGVLTEAQVRGIAVPDDIAVIGFGDQAFAAHTAPALTTVRVDRTALGQSAAEAILARLANPDERGTSTDIGFEIVRRESA